MGGLVILVGAFSLDTSIYRRVGHLCHVTKSPRTSTHWCSTCSLDMIGQAVLEQMFENHGHIDVAPGQWQPTTMDPIIRKTQTFSHFDIFTIQ